MMPVPDRSCVSSLVRIDEEYEMRFDVADDPAKLFTNRSLPIFCLSLYIYFRYKFYTILLDGSHTSD